jgi:hypothetical protein
VLQTIDRKSAIVAAQQLEMGDKSLRKLLRESPQLVADQLPVIMAAFCPRLKSGTLIVGTWHSCSTF